MTCKTLMAHLDVGQDNSAVLRVAADLGTRLAARVVGVAACQPMQFAAADGYGGGDAMAACQDELHAELRAAEAEFRAALSASGLAVEWRSSYTTEALTHYLAGEARCADLIVTSALATDPFDSTRHTSIGDLVMRAGRPLLMVPRAGAPLAFDRVLVAWKDTREARRAVADAVPLLRLAGHVSVLELAEPDELAEALGRVQDVAQWLGRLGITATPQTIVAQGEPAAQLGAILHERQTDLAVAGAYGHNRLREWAFGGMTRALLKGDRCVLLSH